MSAAVVEYREAEELETSAAYWKERAEKAETRLKCAHAALTKLAQTLAYNGVRRHFYEINVKQQVQDWMDWAQNS